MKLAWVPGIFLPCVLPHILAFSNGIEPGSIAVSWAIIFSICSAEVSSWHRSWHFLDSFPIFGAVLCSAPSESMLC